MGQHARAKGVGCGAAVVLAGGRVAVFGAGGRSHPASFGWYFGLALAMWFASWVGQAVWAVVRVRRFRMGYQLRGFEGGWFVLAFIVSMYLLSGQELGWVRAHVAEPFNVPSNSMAPALLQGDQFYVLKIPSSSRHGDIVVFISKDHPYPLVKRIVGLPGDTISFIGRRLVLNGVAVTAAAECPRVEYVDSASGVEPVKMTADCLLETLPGANASPVIFAGGSWREAEATTVSPGHVYLMGDNRNDSLDSRSFGEVAESAIIGRAALIWFSWSAPEGVRWSRIGTSLTLH